MKRHRGHLITSLTANLDRLSMLYDNLMVAGYPEQASSVQWAIIQLTVARGELDKKEGELP